MSGTRRFALLSAGAAVIWYACILIFWALQPLSDSVPVGVDYTLKQPKFVSMTVDCKGLFDSSSRDGSPLPALKAQPKGSPALGYQREPCGVVHRQARLVFAADTIVFLAVVSGAGWFLFWRPRSSSRQRLVGDQPVGLTVS
ncbi:MAG: hypothetical protein ACXWBO_09005 [Ilumatobacteraceae bacterium]